MSVLHHVADLEWVNYAAMQAVARVTPDLELILRDDVVITSSHIFPAPDTTHACLLRANPGTADQLIAEVKDYFIARGLPATVFVSPACTPSDLGARLASQGFARQDTQEAWLVLENLPGFPMPAASAKIAVKPVTCADIPTFASIFSAAFELPADCAPFLAYLLEPCIGLSGVHHYLAWADGQPVGVCSLLCYAGFGILGSAGVLPAYRRGGAATSLALQAAAQALEHGVEALLVQTSAGTPLERLLRISGFKRAFVRTCYQLL